MLILTILLILCSNAVDIRRDKSILYAIIAITVLVCCFSLTINSFLSQFHDLGHALMGNFFVSVCNSKPKGLNYTTQRKTRYTIIQRWIITFFLALFFYLTYRLPVCFLLTQLGLVHFKYIFIAIMAVILSFTTKNMFDDKKVSIYHYILLGLFAGLWSYVLFNYIHNLTLELLSFSTLYSSYAYAGANAGTTEFKLPSIWLSDMNPSGPSKSSESGYNFDSLDRKLEESKRLQQELKECIAKIKQSRLSPLPVPESAPQSPVSPLPVPESAPQSAISPLPVPESAPGSGIYYTKFRDVESVINNTKRLYNKWSYVIKDDKELLKKMSSEHDKIMEFRNKIAPELDKTDSDLIGLDQATKVKRKLSITESLGDKASAAGWNFTNKIIELFVADKNIKWPSRALHDEFLINSLQLKEINDKIIKKDSYSSERKG